MRRDAVVVVGGSVAALVTADALASRGATVELHLPERGVGGSFVPVVIGERRLDLGPRLIELSYDGAVGASPPLSAYRAGPHGHRPYLQLIDALVRDLVGDDLVEVAKPEVSVRGRRSPDYVLTGDLSGLAELVDEATLSVIAAEAGRCVAAEGPHGLFSPGRDKELWEHRFGHVGVRHTGATFHNSLIEPLAAQILAGGSGSVIAALHRKIWLPLFHPVTVLEAATGTLSYRPSRAMHTVEGGGMGEVVRRLIDRIRSHPAIRVELSGPLTRIMPGPTPGTVALELGGGAPRIAEAPVVGVGPEELFGAAGASYEPEKVTATMVWVTVSDADAVAVPSTVLSVDAHLGVFRVTESRADAVDGTRTLCCEIDHRRTSKDEWPGLVERALVALGVVAPTATIDVVAAASRPAFAVPSPENLAKFERSRARVDQLGVSAVVIGGARAFAADSFNEQVVQGLAAAEAARPEGAVR